MDPETKERRDEKPPANEYTNEFTFDADQTWRTNDDFDATWPTRPGTREEPLR